MFDVARDLLAYMYHATEIMEKKAEGFKDEREEQMRAFREKVHEAKEGIESQISEKKSAVSDHMAAHIKDAVNESGVATKEELGEIAKAVNELTEKVDKLSQE